MVKEDTGVYYNLYYNAVGETEIAAAKEAAQGVASFEQEKNTVYILAAQGDEYNTLYLFNPDGTHQKIADNCVQFFINAETSDVVLITADSQQEQLETVTAQIYKDGETEAIDNDINYKFFNVKGSRFAYITGYRESAAAETENTGGEFKIYNGEKTKTIDSEVTGIVDFN